MNIRKFAVFYAPVFLFIILTGCTRHETSNTPKNIILMIGDGMGVTHVYAGMMANGGHLNLEQCQYVGFQKTYSHSSDITDSGASATALASGIKTKNGAIGVDPDGNPVKTIIEFAEENGFSTGLLATATITHATPAAFAAHNPERGNYEEIARDISRSGVDVIIGGGRNHFDQRDDGLNLIDSLITRGYYVSDRIDNIPADHKAAIAIFADTMALPPAAEGRGDLLTRSTALAIGRLSENPAGFFLMVEGSQIDWAAHNHDTDYLVSEMIDFDRAVGKAINFAKEDGRTLVIITADHETGGFSILKGGMKSRKIEGAFSTDGHTGVMVPVYAYGPGAEFFTGIYENTDIFKKMKKLLEF